MDDETTTFLTQVIAWPTEAHPGFVNIHSSWLRPGSAKAIMPGHAFTRPADAIDSVAWRVRQKNPTYVCMSLQRDARDIKPGRRNRGAIRAADNAVLLKSFWLDIDTKNFADEDDLLTRLGQVRRAIGLPVPSIVNFTGGGFHVFWVLTEPVTRDVWQPVADALAEACRQHGLKADHQCTVNAGQVLRVPGSENNRYDPPRLVRIIHTEALVTLADMTGPLTGYRATYRGPVSRATPAQPWSLPPGSRPSAVFAGQVLGPALGSGIDDGKPTMDEVAAACPWFADALATGGAQHREPEWFEALKVSYHTKEGQETAHEVSGGHADYTVQTTDEKYATAAKSAGQYGWPQCRTIQLKGASQCATCRHFVHDKSPLNFALTNLNPAPAPAPGASPGPTAGPIPGTSQTGPALPFFPSGYRYDRQGYIEHEVPLKEGVEWRRMYPVRVNGFVRQKKNRELRFGREMLYFQFEDDDGARDAQINMTAVHDLRQLKNILSEQGMTFKDREADYMGRFMVSFVQQLRNAPHLSVECEPYGWSMKAGVEDAFTFDGTRFNCNGNRQIAPPDVGLGEKFRATGSLDIWKEACRLITDQRRDDLNAIVACGLAAPLVQMTGHNGFVVAAYSAATGVQKSAAMRVSQAIWGHPVSGMAGLDDTNNFLNTRLGALRHLPLFVDELKFADEFRRAETLVLGITQGKTKGRLTRSSETMETFTFNTLMVTASNASLVEHIANHKTTTAGMARIFEFPVERGNGLGIVDTGVAQTMIGKLEHNFGCAGRIYAEFLGKNVPRVRADVANMNATVNEIVRGTTDERFWIAAMTVLIVGARYGNELGLTEIDTDQLAKFLLYQLKRQRGQTEGAAANIGVASNVAQFVIDFINAHPQQTIKTDIVNTMPGRGGPKATVMNDVNSIMGLSRGISIHAVDQQKVVRISVSDFCKWLTKERHIAKGPVLDKVVELLPVKLTKCSIGRGTIYKRAPEPVLEFDVNLMPSIDMFN